VIRVQNHVPWNPLGVSRFFEGVLDTIITIKKKKFCAQNNDVMVRVLVNTNAYHNKKEMLAQSHAHHVTVT
jgi:hypothetical protein